MKWVHRVPINGNKVNVLCEIGEDCVDRNKDFWGKGKQHLYLGVFLPKIECLCIIYLMYLQGAVYSWDTNLRQLKIQAKSHSRVRGSLSPSTHSVSSRPLRWNEHRCSVKWILSPLIHCIVMMEQSYVKTLSAHCPRFQLLTMKGNWAAKLPHVFCPVVVTYIQVTYKWHRSRHTGNIRSVYHMHFLRKAWKPSLTSILRFSCDPLYQKLKGY